MYYEINISESIHTGFKPIVFSTCKLCFKLCISFYKTFCSNISKIGILAF